MASVLRGALKMLRKGSAQPATDGPVYSQLFANAEGTAANAQANGKRMSFAERWREIQRQKAQAAADAAYLADAPRRQAEEAAQAAAASAEQSRQSMQNMDMNSKRDLTIENTPLIVDGGDTTATTSSGDLRRKRQGSGISSQLGINV